MLSFSFSVCVCALCVSDNCSEKLLKAGDETPTGSVTKHGARRAEPGHTRLLLLTLTLCVCVTAFSCMCALSVMFACVSSITTDNTDLLVFALIILHSITLCSFCPLHVQHTNSNTLFNRPNEMVELLKVRTKDFKVDLL